MSTNERNPPAFPSENFGNEGMTLRDWFAGMALQGVHASLSHSHSWPVVELMAKYAYEQADAMLAARHKEPTT